jgi:transposase
MAAVAEVGQPLVDDPARLDGVTGLGVDEYAWQRANRTRHTQFATGIVDITPGRPARLLDVVPGRSAAAYCGWLARCSPAWREQVRTAALDPFRGYLTALRTELPAARHVLDVGARNSVVGAELRVSPGSHVATMIGA